MRSVRPGVLFDPGGYGKTIAISASASLAKYAHSFYCSLRSQGAADYAALKAYRIAFVLLWIYHIFFFASALNQLLQITPLITPFAYFGRRQIKKKDFQCGIPDFSFLPCGAAMPRQAGQRALKN